MSPTKKHTNLWIALLAISILFTASQVAAQKGSINKDYTIAREAAEDFSVPDTYVAINRRATRYTESRLARQGSHTLFDCPKDVERWSVRVRQEVTAVHRYVYHGEPGPVEEKEKNGGLSGFNTDPYILLATLRGERCRPMHAGVEAREGDIAFVLVFEPEMEEADEALSAGGWIRVHSAAS